MANSKKPPYRAVFVSSADCRQKLESYFRTHLERAHEIADVESLAVFLGITRDELTALKSHRIYGRDISLAFERIACIKKQLAFTGKIPATVFAFDMRNNHGYLDKPDADKSEGVAVYFSGKAEEWAK